MIIRVLLVFSLFFLGRISWAQQYFVSTLAGGVPPGTPAPAASQSIGDPSRVAVDKSGNLYFGGTHSVFKVDSSGTLTRIAGTGRSGNSGDGGPATSAQLTEPAGLVADPAGNVYFSDRGANVVRKISANGVITTIAGNGTAGFLGDGGPAIRARLAAPMGIALDSIGNLFIADSGNNCIRRVDTDGNIATFAGTTEHAYSGDGGDARQAALSEPEGLAFDSVGYLYVADTFNHRIRRIAGDGTITTIAGNGFPGAAGDGGDAASANLFFPTDLAFGPDGTLYLADYGTSRIRTVQNRIIDTIAGSTSGIRPTDGQLAFSTRLAGPTGLAVDSTGIIYFAEGSIGTGSGLAIGDYRVWKIIDGVLLTAAGNGRNSFSGAGTAASRSQFDAPAGLALDADGNLYIADARNNLVRRISKAGIVETVAGNGTPGYSGDSGPATQAQLNHPMGVFVEPSGTLYIADTNNNRIRKVQDGTIITIVGNGNSGFFGDGDVAAVASLHGPQSVWVDSDLDVFIADTLNHRVRKVDPSGIVSTLFAARGQGFAGDGGQATDALLSFPTSIFFDNAGNLFIADEGNHRVRKVSTSGVITTVAGSDSLDLGDAGLATNARLIDPRAVAVDRFGTLFIADATRVRKVAGDGSITTVAGTGNCCYTNDGGPATNAELNGASGLAIDPSGTIYVSDTGNQAIRVLQTTSGGTTSSLVANAASNLPGPVAPGEIVALFGTSIGPATPVQAVPNSSGFFGTVLAGVSVTFNGIPAPLLYASAKQVSAIVPYGITGQSVEIALTYQSLIPLSVSLPVAAAAPALFTADSSGSGQALGYNADGGANNASHPAAPGSMVTLYATGEGQTSPAGIDGKIDSAPLPKPLQPVSITIAGQTAAPVSYGGVAGSVAGLMQLQVTIPAISPSTSVPVSLNVGNLSSPPVTIAVGR
jgi:uncharacterized protein (TIGR03437 family)